MLTTLCGENAFLIDQTLHSLCEQFIKENGELMLERIDGSEISVAKAREALTTLPFLADKKMVVIKELSKNKELGEQFEQIIKEIPDSTDLVLIEPNIDKRLRLYKLLKSATDFKEYGSLDLNGLVSWLKDAAKAKGASLSPEDARYLIERVGPNQLLLSQELEKLSLYDDNISRESIDLLTDPSPQSTVFELIEAAFNGKSQKALAIYEEQREFKVEPQQIIGLLSWQLHTLTLIKAAKYNDVSELSKETKLNPFVIRKNEALSAKLSLLNLKELIGRLLKLDILSKQKSIDLDEALRAYLLELSLIY